MKAHDTEPDRQDALQPPRAGTGALCAQAQADGVPCTELGMDCEICGRARPQHDEPQPPP